MGAPFPSEEVAAQVAATLASVDALGRYRAETGEIVVRVPRGASTAGLPEAAAGYPVRYVMSALTSAEVQAARDAAATIGPGPDARFTIRYDPNTDKVVVGGYFPDPVRAQRLAAIKGVEVVPVARYALTDAEWQAQNAAFTAAAPSILASWADFPYDRTPRPTIVTDIPVRCSFLNNVPRPEHLAAVVSSVAIPDSVARCLTRGRPDEPPLHLLHAEYGPAWFMTDRGQAELPAWQLTFTEGPCTVLDPDLPIWWPHTREQWRLAVRRETARIERDGRTVHLNAPGGSATEFLDVEVHETPAAVLAKPITRERAGPHTAVGLHRTMTTTLAKPLGERVLLDAHGTPWIVVPVGTSLRPRWWPDQPVPHAPDQPTAGDGSRN